MGGLYDILESYRDQQNRLNYEGLYEEPADTSINLDPMYNIGARQFGDMRMGMPQVQATGIMQQAPSFNLDLSSLPANMGVANEEDVEQEFLPDQKSSLKDSLSNMGKKFGLSSLLGMVTDNPFLTLLKNNLPEQDPRATGIQDFYSPEGLTSTGSVASGIMQGYNPVSGGFLNMITGGKFGEPTQYGLSGAMQRRIENIIGRRAPQTDSSRSKISELRNLQRQEMQDRSDRGESLGSIGKSTFSGPGMAFEKQSGGSSGKKGTSSERNYGGR
jgi:hypothetical protein